VRRSLFWLIPVIAAAACSAGGSAGVSAHANGGWKGCRNAARPTAVQFQRTEELPQQGLPGPVAVIQRRAVLVRRLYHDVCVLVAHPSHWPSGVAVNCPDDIGLVYRGVFYAGNRRLAVMRYLPTGCPSLEMRLGSARSNYGWFSKGADAAAARFGADFAAVLGIRPGGRQWSP
jgi:hypothetical protein